MPIIPRSVWILPSNPLLKKQTIGIILYAILKSNQRPIADCEFELKKRFLDKMFFGYAMEPLADSLQFGELTTSCIADHFKEDIVAYTNKKFNHFFVLILKDWAK